MIPQLHISNLSLFYVKPVNGLFYIVRKQTQFSKSEFRFWRFSYTSREAAEQAMVDFHIETLVYLRDMETRRAERTARRVKMDKGTIKYTRPSSAGYRVIKSGRNMS